MVPDPVCSSRNGSTRASTTRTSCHVRQASIRGRPTAPSADIRPRRRPDEGGIPLATAGYLERPTVSPSRVGSCTTFPVSDVLINVTGQPATWARRNIVGPAAAALAVGALSVSGDSGMLSATRK